MGGFFIPSVFFWVGKIGLGRAEREDRKFGKRVGGKGRKIAFGVEWIGGVREGTYRSLLSSFLPILVFIVECIRLGKLSDQEDTKK